MSTVTTKIQVNSNLAVIGTVSPYSYQVKGKAGSYAGRQFVEFDGADRPSRLTKGQGKGQVVRYYAYFMAGDVQHWIELPASTYTTLAADPASKLILTRMTVPTPAEQVVTEQAVEQASKTAPVKTRKASRQEA